MRRFLKIYTTFISSLILICLGAIFTLTHVNTESVLVEKVEKKSSTRPILIKTSQIENIEKLENSSSEILKTTGNEFQRCEGSWILTDSFSEKIEIETSTIQDWSYESNPSILFETINSANKVIIGHNYCSDGNCDTPTTDFSQIINSKMGDSASLCLNGILYEGKIIVSNAFPDTATYAMGNWLRGNSVTMFTCYGDCEDKSCTSTEERWVTAFEVRD